MVVLIDMVRDLLLLNEQEHSVIMGFAAKDSEYYRKICGTRNNHQIDGLEVFGSLFSN